MAIRFPGIKWRLNGFASGAASDVNGIRRISLMNALRDKRRNDDSFFLAFSYRKNGRSRISLLFLKSRGKRNRGVQRRSRGKEELENNKHTA